MAGYQLTETRVYCSGVRKHTFVTQSIPTVIILLNSLALVILSNYVCNSFLFVLGLFCWEKNKFWEFPGGPVVGSLLFHCWFNPQSGNQKHSC